MWHAILSLVCAVAFPVDGPTPAKSSVPVPVPDEALKGLAGTLRGLLLQSLPATLYEASPNWGHQAVPRIGRNLGVKRGPRNEGTWRKIRLSTRNPDKTLTVDLSDWKYPDAEHMTFTAKLSVEAEANFEQQIWQAGLRLYSGSMRSRFRLYLNLQCEVIMRAETGPSIVPDFVIRLRVVHSDLRYDNLVVEHVAGIGGTGAQVLGDALRSHMQQWHPEVERNLLARANAAVVKAADTREVRISLATLLTFKK